MTEIETDLRAWMQERAARVHASPEILAADYRPRTRRAWRPRLALGGGVAVVAATVTAVLSLAGGASTAFAGWSAQPTTPSAAQLQAAQTACPASRNPALTQAVVDARGPYTIMVYTGSAGSAQTDDFCTDGPYFESSSGWTTSPPVTPPAGQLYLWMDNAAGDNEHPYDAMIAQAGAGVTAANLTLTDGTVVTATVHDGWVAGWWPGSAHVASAAITTPSGTHTQTFAAYPCDLHNCSGGPHGGAPGGGPGGG